MSNEEKPEATIIDEEKVIHLCERRPNYTCPMNYALAAVENYSEAPEKPEKSANKNLTFDEKLNVASQLAGISKEQAVSFCMILKQL